jgi:dTDP-4-dehydrorhamnose reductase
MYQNFSTSENRVVCNQYGSPTYVPHLADAIARLVTSEAYGTFHMVGIGQATRWDLVVELFRILKVTAPVRPVS